MILAVNIGNTNTSVGFWRDGRIRQESTPTASLLTGADFRRFLENQLEALGETPVRIEGCIMASVVPDKTQLVSAVLEDIAGIPPRIVGNGSETGMDLSAYDSSLLGTDRVVCCAAALAKYPPPLVVFDLGTATTANVVDAGGSFLGGAILPGVRMGLEALAAGTSQLPLLNLSGDVHLIGRDTRQCLAAGAAYGAACAMEGYTRRVEEALGQRVTTVITGGNASQVSPYCKGEFHHEPTLLLEGLARLHQGIGSTNRKGDHYAVNQ